MCGSLKQRGAWKVFGAACVLGAFVRAAAHWALLVHAAYPPLSGFTWQGPLAAFPQLTASPSAVLIPD